MFIQKLIEVKVNVRVNISQLLNNSELDIKNYADPGRRYKPPRFAQFFISYLSRIQRSVDFQQNMRLLLGTASYMKRFFLQTVDVIHPALFFLFLLLL